MPINASPVTGSGFPGAPSGQEFLIGPWIWILILVFFFFFFFDGFWGPGFPWF